ncbi:MAG TPA: putative metal-binding motif-containing protein, partial [Myxococcota bacterium]|nr:putative metal-binding motif-containing protein [Myxococcota bacterium]
MQDLPEAAMRWTTVWVLAGFAACRGTLPDDTQGKDPIGDTDVVGDSDTVDTIDTEESDADTDRPAETDTVAPSDTDVETDPPILPPDVDGDGAITELDCDDLDPAVYPGAEELAYDGVDNDCDPLTRDDDLDGDGFVLDVDCDDADAALNPGAQEVAYDGIDQDCDPLTVDDDLDGDGWALAEDCDDLDAAVRPDAVEACNQVDDDCDAAVDEDVPGAPLWFQDLDGDRYGDPGASMSACSQPLQWVDDATDCDDRVPSVHPGAPEVCDGLDNDCDQLIDDGALNDGTFYLDDDGDGFGDPGSMLVTCTPPPGYVPAPGDCRDDLPGVYPGAVELCDGVDEDCDGVVDDGAADDATWYADGDADGWGADNVRLVTCDPGPGWVLVDGDCDDGDAAVSPGGIETCDGEDEDCDGIADDDAVDP